MCSHTINLLANMPGSSYEELLTVAIDPIYGASATARDEAHELDTEYAGKNMAAIAVLLNFLDNRLSEVCVMFSCSTVRKNDI